MSYFSDLDIILREYAEPEPPDGYGECLDLIREAEMCGLGSLDFVISLKHQVKLKGTLSKKQKDAINRLISRTKSRNALRTSFSGSGWFLGIDPEQGR